MLIRQTSDNKGPYEINWARYMEIAAIAVRDISTVLGEVLSHHPHEDHHKQYETRVHTEMPRIPKMADTVPHTRELVRNIARRFGFSVEFWPRPLGKFGLPTTFQSWITVRFNSKHLDIFYDGEQIAKLASSPSECVKLTAKTLLHECAHAVLHRHIIKSMIEKNGTNPFPSLEEHHEQEAWFYALLLWAVLVGDHAYKTRVDGNGDKGWTLA